MSDSALRALIVEDERAWQQILSEILSDMGLAIDVAEDHDTAVACLRSVAHRVAVVDLSLNDMDYQNQDGLRVLDAVQRFDPGCVAVLLTGYATVELAVSALNEHGAMTCLRKESFRRAQFREVLRQALTRPEGRRSGDLSAEVGDAGALLGAEEARGRPRLHESAAPAETDRPKAGERLAGESMEGERPLWALLVEDDAGWRAILAELLEGAGYHVRQCSSYGEALGCLRREKYVVAVVDLSLANSLAPDGNTDGCQVLEKVRDAGFPAIVVSGQGTRESVERAYADFGMFAYLEKQAFDRSVFLSTVAEAVRMLSVDDPLARLTRREREVLALLAQGLTNKGIASAMVISTNTVKRYLKSIFEKLDVDSRAAATARAVSGGLIAGR